MVTHTINYFYSSIENILNKTPYCVTSNFNSVTLTWRVEKYIFCEIISPIEISRWDWNLKRAFWSNRIINNHLSISYYLFWWKAQHTILKSFLLTISGFSIKLTFLTSILLSRKTKSHLFGIKSVQNHSSFHSYSWLKAT